MPAYEGEDTTNEGMPVEPPRFGDAGRPPEGSMYPVPMDYPSLRGGPQLAEENTPHYGAVGRVPWPLSRTLAGTAITLVPWLAIQAFTVLGSQGQTGTTPTLTRTEDLIGGIIFFLFSAVVECAFLLAPLYAAVWRREPGVSAREGLRALGFRRAALGPAAAWAVGGLAVGLAATFAYGYLIDLLHLPLQTNGAVLAQEALKMPLTVLGALAAAVFIAPVCEEVFFRGYLFGGLLRGMEMWAAALISGLLFALAHFDIGSFVPLFIFGLVVATVRFKTGSIWPGAAIHVCFNLLTSIAIVALILQH
jgi:membrane protease YdiL (CAAX protease family)